MNSRDATSFRQPYLPVATAQVRRYGQLGAALRCIDSAPTADLPQDDRDALAKARMLIEGVLAGTDAGERT